MNLVIPIASDSKFFNHEDFGYPKPLIEIFGLPMIEYVVKNLIKDCSFRKIIFIVKQEDCNLYHLDNVLSLITPIKPVIIRLRGGTQGALCSVLLAIEHINNEEPLVISNADQIFDHGISNYLNKFIISDADAACLTIDSVHPRWSYVKTDGQGNVIEASEKRPISRNAIAGIYLYKKGSEFIKSAMQCIKNGSSIESRYYTSLVFNEYILRGKEVAHYSVPNEHFHSFYSPQRIEEYESTQVQCKEW